MDPFSTSFLVAVACCCCCCVIVPLAALGIWLHRRRARRPEPVRYDGWAREPESEHDPATHDTLLHDVFDCDACAGDGLGFTRAASGRLHKFPPTIGATGAAPILLVGTNPRIDQPGVGNRWLHELLASDFGAFAKLSSNRLPSGGRYISTTCDERHYRLHARIADEAFPGVPFERVAAVTEVHLCATRKSSGLHQGTSRCADRHLMRTVGIVQPAVIVVIGAHARDYLLPRCRIVDGFPVLAAGGVGIPLVEVPHPNSRERRRECTEQAIEVIKAVLSTPQ